MEPPSSSWHIPEAAGTWQMQRHGCVLASPREQDELDS
jgi:hypothetical protein